MRRVAVVIILFVVIVGAFASYRLSRPRMYELKLFTYFKDAQGLKAGTPVRLAGVDVGKVLSVRARPDLTPNPAEVQLVVSTPYELKIPQIRQYRSRPSESSGTRWRRSRSPGVAGRQRHRALF